MYMYNIYIYMYMYMYMCMENKWGSCYKQRRLPLYMYILFSAVHVCLCHAQHVLHVAVDACIYMSPHNNMELS